MIESSFSITPITNPESSIYSKAINIYNTTTPIDIKTNSNQIAYWLKNQCDKFKIYNFALNINGQTVGYAMTAYLTSTKIMVYDYIAINNNNRNNTVFLTFFSLIKMFFKDKKIDIDYYIVEISNKNNGKEIDKESLLFLKFLCLEDFSKINIEYDSLPLGFENKESAFKAYLYIKPTNDRQSINSESFISMVRSLYEDYYLSWYKPFFNEHEIQKYMELIKNSLSILENNLKHKNTVSLLHQQCHYSNNKNTKTNDIPIINPKKKLWLLLIIPLLIIAPLGIAIGYNFILEKIGIAITSVDTILGAVLGAGVTGIITLIIFLVDKNNHNF